MQEDLTRLEELYIKWYNKTATPEERAELIALLEAGVTQEQLTPLLSELWESLREDDSFSFHQKQQLADKILQQWPAEPVVAAPAQKRLYAWKWIAAAAVLLLIGSPFIWKLLSPHQGPAQKKAAVATSVEVIQPGRQGAVLTLADGRRVVLDSVGKGVISSQEGTRVIWQNNQLVYETGNGIAAANSTACNTMATPKGRQFQLVLPDGSKVWLNAASSIRYPVVFAKNERKVELTGEAYFEVAHDKARPFRVQTPNQVVQALGTGFNVNAYENEGLEKTTLIEGRVSVTTSVREPAGNHPRSVILNPGQQAVIDQHKQAVRVSNDQTEAAVAWKNGYFYLENMPFDQVMKQLERWYDIQVQYENGVPDLHFVGGLSRNMTLNALIRALQVSEVHFKMEAGRRLIVYK